jgi:thiamine kinase-like enzyme
LLGKDNENQILLGNIARKLAHIHSLRVPIERNPNLIFQLMRKYLEEGYKNFPFEELLSKFKCNTLLGTNFIKEIEWIEKCVKDCKSPVVFTHNDFRQSNILIEQQFDDKLTFIDYEYSGYTFRAMDFGIFFTEFNRTSLLFSEFPEEQKVIHFLEQYRRESIQIFGTNFSDDKQNSLESLLMETKVSYIFQVLYMVLFCIKAGDEIGLELSKQSLLVIIMSEFFLFKFFEALTIEIVFKI